MLQQTRASECHCCLMVKYLSQLHEQFISPVPLVQFNWYCERGGDNEDALTLGRENKPPFFPKMFTDVLYFSCNIVCTLYFLTQSNKPCRTL